MTLASGPPGNPLEKFGLLPAEIRNAATGSLLERTVVRALAPKLAHLGQSESLITITLPTGNELTFRYASQKFDIAEVLSKLEDAAGDIVATAMPRVAQVGRQVRQGVLEAAVGAFQDFNWSGLPRNVSSYVSTSIGPLLRTTAGAIEPQPSYIPKHSFRHPEAQLRFFRGSVLDGNVTEVAPAEIKNKDVGDSKWVWDPADQLLIVQLLCPNQPTRNLLLPPGATLQLSRGSEVGIAIAFGDRLTDQAVQLRARTFLAELTAIGKSLTTEELRSLGSKPTGAAVCLLYLVLRTRDADTVNMTLDALSEHEAGRSPDAAVIRAELAARSGDYRAALGNIREAIARGLPYFGQGVGTIADRLQLLEKITRPLEDAHPATADSWSEHDRSAIKAALDRIEPFSANCDYSAPVTTYSGPHPAKPGTAPLTRAEFLGTTGFPISS